MELKNITEVALKTTPELTENVVVEDNGVAKRVPMSAIKTGGGAGFDIIVTAKAVPVEESGSGSYSIPFTFDEETINIETELSFADLMDKWYYHTLLVALDGKDSGYRPESEVGEALHWKSTNLGGESLVDYPVFDCPAETATMLSSIGLTISEGDDFILYAYNSGPKNVVAEESGGDSAEAGFYGFLCFKEGSEGEIALEIGNMPS